MSGCNVHFSCAFLIVNCTNGAPRKRSNPLETLLGSGRLPTLSLTSHCAEDLKTRDQAFAIPGRELARLLPLPQRLSQVRI